ncbi:hypothetical protein [Yersinia rohdei]|uniref:hypothetical protein n=1 Tax=Yersinia rohdei TaxID=29485 RepID=UPI0011A110DE|nr:hypothetical protein [Yersinia rohdei]MDN0094001.1 hypothetical protein [Yersinia rohdei]
MPDQISLTGKEPVLQETMERNKQKEEKYEEKIFTTQHGWHAWRSEMVSRLLEAMTLGSVVP